jgi:glycosyltransferase involved in cell wall biosynthesis
VDQYLQQTIDDLLAKAEGEIEIIVVLDGYWPDPIVRDDPRVIILHQGMIHDNIGMRGAINSASEIARGDYIMKIDEHCMVDQGFDVKLAADCEDDWVVIPRRYRLDADNWQIVEDGRPPVDYMYLAYPYERPYDRNCGLHGSEWKRPERNHILIDDTMSWQGSCWFLKKSYWDKLLYPLDDKNYGPFTQEAQEIGNKVWLSGGRLVVNKKTWYAHFHKGSKGKGYGFSREQYKRHEAAKERGRLYCIEYWLNTKDYKHDFEWLLQKFWPVPTWPENWKERIKLDAEKDWSKDPSRQPTEWLG